MKSNTPINELKTQIQQLLPDIPLPEILKKANVQPDMTLQEQFTQLQNFPANIHEYNQTKKNHLLQSHKPFINIIFP